MEALAASLGLSVAMLVGVVLTATLLFPAFWLWMLVDALVREPVAYPSKDIGEKVMWVLVLAFIQPAALIYFFLVWTEERRSTVAAAKAAVA